MQKYELMLIVGATNSNEKSAKDIIGTVKKELEKNGANILFDEFWGIKKLAYKIKKNTEGYYHLFNFEGKKENAAKLENFLRINTDIIRYLITKIDDKYKPFDKNMLEQAEKQRYEEIKEAKLKRPVRRKPEEIIGIEPIIDLEEKLDKLLPIGKKTTHAEGFKDLDSKLEKIMLDL